MVPTDFLHPAQVKAQFAIEKTQRRIRLSQYFLESRNDRCRPALQDRLVNLCLQGIGVTGRRVEGREKRRSPRQVALSLSDPGLKCESILIVRCNIENLVKLSQRFGETAKLHIGDSVLGKQGNVAGVEPLGFVKVRLALLPLASPARDIGERFRNPAAIWEKRTCLLKVTHGRVVILEAGVVIIALSPYSLAEVGLKSERSFGGLSRLFP